jgi:hypothetical protein
MKATRVTTLLALLLMAGGVTMQGQEYYDLEEVFVTDEATPVYAQYINTEEMIVFTTNTEKFQFIKMRENGEILGTVDYPFAPESETYLVSRFMRLPNHKYLQFFYETVEDSTTFHAIEIDEDLQMTVKDYGDKMGDFMLEDGWQTYITRAVVCKDGTSFLAYAPDSLYKHSNGNQVMTGVRIMKFDSKGELVGERVFDDLIHCVFNHWLEPAPDSLGCRLIVQELNDYGSYYGIYVNGYLLDSELNTVLKRENISSFIYPGMIEDPDSYHANPYNGKIYVVGSVNTPYPQPIDDEIGIAVMDENFVEENYTWGMHRLVDSQGAQQNAIDFTESGDVYMLAHMDFRASIDICNNFYLAWLDEDLNKKGEIYYHNETRALYPVSVHASPNGGCLVICIGFNREDPSVWEHTIFKVSQGILDDIEEAHDAGFAVAVAYPNPGKDVLNIRTELQNARVEVYDMNGRMVYRQEITENVTAINTTDWSEGTYVWKLMADGKEVESGKWIKE